MIARFFLPGSFFSNRRRLDCSSTKLLSPMASVGHQVLPTGQGEILIPKFLYPGLEAWTGLLGLSHYLSL
ncbi:hypothetical protein [Prochlorococcus sp.P1363]|uniref:hypothetical protein n=1 Tax=unclassified Prochlorococcus TaxID=2627481 RepID=UPI00145DBA8E|nr:hypothetical protein [Prochlorococcus sp.P1363]NMP13024.1 hypothetical protein [Prochlorococcus sp.P1363]